MIVFHILTAVLVVLQVMDIISVSWWLVVTPSLFAFGMGFVLLLISIIAIALASK